MPLDHWLHLRPRQLLRTAATAANISRGRAAAQRAIAQTNSHHNRSRAPAPSQACMRLRTRRHILSTSAGQRWSGRGQLRRSATRCCHGQRTWRAGLSSFAQLMTPRRWRDNDIEHGDCGADDMPGALMPPGSAAAVTLPHAVSAVVAGLYVVAEAEMDAGAAEKCQRDTLRALCAVGVWRQGL
jgi:hypothetical protein